MVGDLFMILKALKCMVEECMMTLIVIFILSTAARFFEISFSSGADKTEQKRYFENLAAVESEYFML